MEEAQHPGVGGPFHVPQQSRRHKLRFTTPQDDDVVEFSLLSPQQAGGLNLSLSTYTRSGGAYSPSPVGPFTGYALILGRSRFLRPAQELLEDFCRGSGVSSEEAASKLLQDSGTWFPNEDDISRRCANPSLVSLLQEVYKRYRLYCQQMHSAVTSFESVAGLANAAPFVGCAIKAVFRNFQCLKNAILDHIRFTTKSFGAANPGKGATSSGSCLDDKDHFEQNHALDANFIQHPVWRSQRGFPEKAVSVLRTWLFEHFLHPYPSDSDKQMLAQKTGLSRSQVSNWFTNARVRLWKPMVEEMHALERKTQCSKAPPDTPQLNNSLGDQQIPVYSQPSQSQSQSQSQREFQIYSTTGQDSSQCKRSRIEVLPSVVGHSKEQFGIPCYHLPNNQPSDVGGSQTPTGELLNHSSAQRSSQETATALSWSAPGQIVPFWLAKQ